MWFREDLRVADNPALVEAVNRAGEVFPVFVDETPGRWRAGSAARVFRRSALAALDERLAGLGAPLTVLKGDPREVLPEFARATGAGLVTWNRRYDPDGIAIDKAVKADLSERHEVRSFASRLMLEPFEVANRSGKPFLVFTPFYRHCSERYRPEMPLAAPESIGRGARRPAAGAIGGRTFAAARPLLAGDGPWVQRLEAAWEISEAGAWRHFDRFASAAIDSYERGRDVPAAAGVSRLSPYLHFGLISPRQLWHALEDLRGARGGRGDAGMEAFLRQLFWRDFAHHLLFHFPETSERPLKRPWDAFPWCTAEQSVLEAWQRGRTGYPFVDAGMRELWATGWMHNRVRMVVGSFLTKHLGVHWLEGARWFWDTLVDADLANNTLGWQWVAGCGADAAPYFRIFNPTTQGQKFDPDGSYVRRWVPELAALPDRHLHAPDAAPAEVLAAAGVELGRDYPLPVVAHRPAREAALARYDVIKGAK